MSDLSSQLMTYLHILLVVAGTIMYAISFVISMAFLIQDNFLKRKKQLPFSLPGLVSLDRINFSFILFGLISMGGGVLLGFLPVGKLQIQVNLTDVRVVTSLLLLLLSSYLIWGRFASKIHPKGTAWISILGFSSLIASFIFIHFFGGSFHLY
jgi:ABC-type uncharacterized transport system permease subunit